MDVIEGELREMKIELHLDAKPVKHHPYWLNPNIKKNVKQ